MKTINNIPILGLGTWMIGGDKHGNDINDERDVKGVKEALNQGITLIDTAEVYGKGHSEEIIGEAIKDYDRSKLFIVTKVSGQHALYDQVIEACKGSLKRLQTDYIDLYLLHHPDTGVKEETFRAMNHLKEQGLIKRIGVSNFSAEQLEQAGKYSEIVANQIEYNLFARNKGQFTVDMEKEIIPYCQEHNIVVMAFRPFAQGNLWDNPVLVDMAKKYNKTVAQICIQWLVSKKNIMTIPKSVDPDHIRDNLAALDFEISKEDLEVLDKLA